MLWEILLTIPYGQTMTYGDIAKQIANQKGIAKMSAQAVLRKNIFVETGKVENPQDIFLCGLIYEFP